MGKYNIDHLEIIGIDPNPQFDLKTFYLRLAGQLSSLQP
jgi:triacylglycerol lipase